MPFIAWLMAGLSTLVASRLGSWFVGALIFMGIELATSSFVVTPILNEIKGAAGAVTGTCG